MHTTSRRARARAALAVASLALVAAPAAAHAQLGGVNPFSFGVSGGALVPLGDFGRSAKTGYVVDGLVALRVPTLPVSFRAEVGYARNDLKAGVFDDFGNTGGANVSAYSRMLFGTANVILPFAPPASPVRPYLIGGVGVYNVRVTGTVSLPGQGSVTANSPSQSKFGLNGGAGVEIPLSGISVFGEVRYTSVFTQNGNTNFLPIKVGVRF